jgi:hypothetical protein
MNYREALKNLEFLKAYCYQRQIDDEPYNGRYQ